MADSNFDIPVYVNGTLWRTANCTNPPLVFNVLFYGLHGRPCVDDTGAMVYLVAHLHRRWDGVVVYTLDNPLICLRDGCVCLHVTEQELPYASG